MGCREGRAPLGWRNGWTLGCSLAQYGNHKAYPVAVEWVATYVEIMMQLPVKLKLPLLEVVMAAFRLPVQMRSQLLPAIRWPLGALVVLQLASFLTGGAEGDAVAVGPTVVYILLGMVVSAMIAVPAHQIFIRGELEGGAGGLQWSSRETFYLLWSIGLPMIVVVLASLISMPLVAIAMTTGMAGFMNLAVLVALIAGVAVYGRFSMVMPRIALGQSGGLRAAGQMAAGHYWRVGMIGLLFPLLISLVPTSLQAALGPVGLFLAVIASVYFSVVQIAALALVYRWLQEFADPPQADQRDEDEEESLSLDDDLYQDDDDTKDNDR